LQLEGKRTCKLFLSQKNAAGESSVAAEKERNVAARQAAFTIFDAFLDAVVVINDAGIVQYANSAIEQMTGYKPNELVGKNVSQLMTEEYKKFHDGYLRAYLKSRTPKIIGTGRDVIMQKKDGSISPIHLQVTEKTIGDKLYFFGTMKKASDAVQQKTMLQQEREVLDGLIVPAVIIDEKGIMHGFNAYVVGLIIPCLSLSEFQLTLSTVCKISSSATRLLGYTLVDVINRNVSMLMTSPDREKHDGYLAKYAETGKAKIIGVGRKVVAQAKDGSLKTIYLSVTEKKDKEKRIYTGILQEI
jgi:PAS domain S-box-containing protein